MGASLDFDRTPTEAEIRKIRVACRWMLLPYLAMVAAILMLAVSDVSAGNGLPVFRVVALVAVTMAIAMGYQFYVGSLPCPRCGRSVLGDSMAMKPRFPFFGELRCNQCGLSFLGEGPGKSAI